MQHMHMGAPNRGERRRREHAAAAPMDALSQPGIPPAQQAHWSFSRPRMDSGPKSSSGTEKRVSRRSK